MTLRELCSLNTSWIARSLCKLVQCSHRSCQRDARRPSPRPSLPPHQCLYLITTPARRLCAGNQLGDNVEHLVTWSAPARSLMNKQAQRGVLKQRKRERKISQICHLSRSTLASLASPGRSAKHFASTSRPYHSRRRRVGVSFLHLMYASAARFLRIKPVPANFLSQAAEPVHAARSHVPVHQPSVAEQLLARSDVPPNLRVEPYVNRKSKFWKVCMLRWH